MFWRVGNELKFQKQEILGILTIAVREIMHAYIRNLKKLNIDVQQDFLAKKE